MSTAVITGITGQDGAYLSKLLLSKGYQVYGIARRSSVDTKCRLRELGVLDNPMFDIIEGDITDMSSVLDIVGGIKPDELYNLAAQSHVYTSFNQPSYTWGVNATGCLNLLEAVRRQSPDTRFYQASTSEMFGNNYSKQENGVCYQDEDTALKPTSPYAIAKTAAHQMVQMYRSSYNIHASCGILFNHECLKYDMPIIIKYGNGVIDILSIQSFAEFNGFDGKTDCKTGVIEEDNISVWDNNSWTKINRVSWFKNQNKKLRIINARNAVYAVSDDHKCIMEDDTETQSSNLVVGNKVKLTSYPDSLHDDIISCDEAELLGMLVGDGTYLSSCQFTNSDESIRNRFSYLWSSVTGGTSKYYPSKSGFTGEIIGRLDLSGGSDFLDNIVFYDEACSVFGTPYKKVPLEILNAPLDVMEAFLIGYNACDGLKANKCKYRFKNFKTNSPILASGLLFLVTKVTGQKYNITVEQSYKYGIEQIYYSINLLSDRISNIDKYDIVSDLLGKYSQREIHRKTNISRSFIRKVANGYIPSKTHYLELPNNEIKKIIDVPNYNGWFFDIETESHTLHAGVGQGVIHNSELRGENFVTRKITQWVADLYRRLLNGDLPVYTIGPLFANEHKWAKHFGGGVPCSINTGKLKLGNLDACRDWGHAEDYVLAMWLMLQQDTPDNYVVATGQTHTVLDFVTAAFKAIGIEHGGEDYIRRFIDVDPKLCRPSEVNYLLGNPKKAAKTLGWKPTISFEQLVQRMVDHDIEELLKMGLTHLMNIILEKDIRIEIQQQEC